MVEWAHVCGVVVLRFAPRAGWVSAGLSVQEYDRVLQHPCVSELVVLLKYRGRKQ